MTKESNDNSKESKDNSKEPKANSIEQNAGERLREAARRLLDWYPAVARDLPWRAAPREPYAVWVSEIMLQQTRIEAVLEPYARFMERYPTLPDLAAAPEEEVLKLWEGLGYYSRARNLRKAAIVCAGQYGGRLPQSFVQLKNLPGLGEYTAGAIASIAFGEAVPAVDGNVLRVLARLLKDARDVLEPAVRKEMTARLRETLAGLAESRYTAEKTTSPGLFNEALMELGETLCLPNGQPLCGKCPLQDLCLAHAAGCEATLPTRRGHKTRRVEERTVLLLCAGDTVALRRRPEEGLLAGMYEFPSLEGFCRAEELPEKLECEYGIAPRGVLRTEALPEAKHLFTHIEWRMRGFRIWLEAPADSGLLWVSARELESRCAVPSAFAVYRNILKRSENT